MSPILNFPTLKYGDKEAPLDLRCLLFRGGSAMNRRDVENCMGSGQLGAPLLERMVLIEKVHEHLTAKLLGGGSRRSLETSVASFRSFISYVDRTGHPLNLDTVQRRYMEWTDHYLHRVRMHDGISERSAYGLISQVGSILDVTLERSRPIVLQTRLRYKTGRYEAPTSKQDLEATFEFGYMLDDLCKALTLDVIRGPLPIRIKFRTGHCLERWCRLSGTQDGTRKEVWEAHNLNTSLQNRSRVINLRIEAELLIFIAQTGMNWTQAVETKLGDFSYTSHIDGYQVRRRKNRRNGDVEFEIFKAYRPHLECYLSWRRTLFPDASKTLLFQFIPLGEREQSKRNTKQIRTICEDLQIEYIGPMLLRKTRINFLLRESNDLDMTAEMAQHSKEVLVRHYLQPNHQVAIVEIHSFHQKNDPSIAPPGPGSCVSEIPEPLDNTPTDAPQPNCVNPAGCLFCAMHRDVDSHDYVWSLASFRHLKTLELSMSRKTQSNDRKLAQPAYLVVDRIERKLKQFETSSLVRKDWVDESLLRIAEGHHHPMWHGFIQMAELSS